MNLIKKAIDNGFKIGNLANMTIEELENIITKVSEAGNDFSDGTTDHISETVNFIKNFDSSSLNNLIGKLSTKLSKKDFLKKFVIHLLKEIGDLWEKGDLRVSNEHFASTIIRNSLINMIETPQRESSPVVVSGTPKNQQHELMALVISVLLSMNGFRVVYLGASVPAEDIISTAQTTNAIAVILSLIYPPDDFTLLEELKKMKRSLGKTDIYIGGGSALSYYEKLKTSGIIYCDDPDKCIEMIKSSRHV